MTERASLPLIQSQLADRYAVERELGYGGMATVYLAEEVKHGRSVAIKVLHPSFAPTLDGERFLREIGIAASLSHPHLVPLIDSGETGGLPYYVSSYLPDGSLRDRLRRDGRLALDAALRVARDIGGALDYMHRTGFVHRDVKPENILFADNLALLADFGIARSTHAGGRGVSIVTGAGYAVGTPEYMSPEQASGDSMLDRRSDVYSLACVVFEMLVGDPPFHDASPRAIMAKQVSQIAPRVRTLRPEIPAGVDDAIARALAKDPAKRFASVAEFTAALRSAVPTQSRVSIAPVRSIAVLPFVNASPDPQNEYLSDGITDELIDGLAKVEGIRVASRTSVFALKGKPQDIRVIGALLDSSVVLEGTVRRAGDQLRITAQLTSTGDGSLVWSHRYDRTLDDVFAIQDEIARTIVNTLRATSFADLAPPRATHHTVNADAYRLYLKGRYEWNRRTQAGIASGIRYFEQAIAADPAYAAAYTGLADCYALEVDYRSVPVGAGFEAAKMYARRAIELDDSLADAHASLAWSFFVYDWDWSGAEREFRRAIDLDPQYASAHQWFALLLASRGQLSEALVAGHTAVELDGGSVSARRTLAWCYYYARRYDQARYHINRAIAMNPDAEENYRVLGHVLAVEGNADEAIHVLYDAITMPDSGTYTRATLGYALARAHRERDARAILADLEARAGDEYVSPVSFATLLLGFNDVERALDWSERAWDDRRGWLAYLKVNPIMDPLRGHPRFDALVRRMRL